MRTTRRTFMLTTAAGAGALAAPAVLRAQAPLVLKMAHIYAPGNIWFETAEAYARGGGGTIRTAKGRSPCGLRPPFRPPRGFPGLVSGRA